MEATLAGRTRGKNGRARSEFHGASETRAQAVPDMTDRRGMPIRRRTNATERMGVAFVRSVVETANSVFKEIDRAHDYGHDAFALLVDGEQVTAKEIALQIKAGVSFCTKRTCRVPATRPQLRFWARHDLITIGVVYDPAANCAWWVDLQAEAKGPHRSDDNPATVTFRKSDWNRFDHERFAQVLLPALLGQPPRVDLATALAWAGDADPDTHHLGVRTLLARFRQEAATWDLILRLFRERRASCSIGVFLGLVRIMGHPDEGYFSDEVPSSIRHPVQRTVLEFGKTEVVALLEFVEEGNFERGEIGNGLFAIVPNLPHGLQILRDIAGDAALGPEVRENADLLLRVQRDDPEWWDLWRPKRLHPEQLIA